MDKRNFEALTSRYDKHELALALGTSIRSINRWVEGARPVPASVAVLVRIFDQIPSAYPMAIEVGQKMRALRAGDV